MASEVVRWMVVAGDALLVVAGLAWMILTDRNYPPHVEGLEEVDEQL